MPGREVGKRGAVFLDRDGVLNELVPDARSGLPESPYSPDDMRLAEGAVEALRILRTLDSPLIVVSNQPAAAKRTCSLEDLKAVDTRFRDLLAAAGVGVHAIEYCFHHPEASDPDLLGPCQCRKPAPGLLEQSALRLGVDPRAAWIIGDSDVDIEAGRSIGTGTILVEAPASAHRRRRGVASDFRVPSVLCAASIVVANWPRPVPEDT